MQNKAFHPTDLKNKRYTAYMGDKETMFTFVIKEN
jgi:hypothetical protein